MKIDRYVEGALLDMLKTKPVTQIYVSKIIEEVGICKATFYKYYCDKYDLLQKCFYNEYYREIIEHSETFMQFIGNCLNAFKKSPKIVLHAMMSEDLNSIFGYNSRLVSDYVIKDMEREGMQTDTKYYEYIIRIYSQNVTQIIVDWLGEPQLKSVDEVVKLIRDVMPAALLM